MKKGSAVMEQEIAKIKFICRMQKGTYSRQLLLDNTPAEACSCPEVQRAVQFFEAFSPEQLTREGCDTFGEGFVLVFRTDTSQMQALAEEIQKLSASASA